MFKIIIFGDEGNAVDLDCNSLLQLNTVCKKLNKREAIYIVLGI